MTARPLNVLFVDDEPGILLGIRRGLRSIEGWELHTAEGAPQALELMGRVAIDVIVTDMRMPGMNGVHLLQETKRRHPDVARLVLSGQADEDLVQQTVGLAHRFLNKPCSAAVLAAAIACAAEIRGVLTDVRLRALVAQIDDAPTLPALYLELAALRRSDSSSAVRIAAPIATASSATILAAVNADFLGPDRQATGLVDAIGLIGLDLLRVLALWVHASTHFAAGVDEGFLRAWRRHSLETADLARAIASAERSPRAQVDEAFMAGLLHDIGKLILAANFADESASDGATLNALQAAEWTIHGVTHAEVGAYFLGLWGLPDQAIEAVAFQRRPNRCQGTGFSTLAVVHAANAISEEADGASSTLDEGYLRNLGFAGRVTAWRTLRRPRGSAT